MLRYSDLLSSEECLYDEGKARIGFTSSNQKWKYMEIPMLCAHSILFPKCVVRREFVRVSDMRYKEEDILCIQCKIAYRQAGSSELLFKDKFILPRKSASKIDENSMKLNGVDLINAHLIRFENPVTQKWGRWKWDSFDIDVNLPSIELNGPLMSEVFVKPDKGVRVFSEMRPLGNGLFEPIFVS